MDSLITAAAFLLAQGDPLGALRRIALREDAPALALRGIAMAQLGELSLARTLLKSAANTFSSKEVVAKARCIIAEAEIAIVTRDLNWPLKLIEAAKLTLEEHGDYINAAHAEYLKIRRDLLLGNLDDVETALDGLNPKRLPPALRTTHELAKAGIAIRRLRTTQARNALTRAWRAATQSRIPALATEVKNTENILRQPIARLVSSGIERPLLLGDVEKLLTSKKLVVDACRFVVCQMTTTIALTKRPVLFTLVRELGEAWPQEVAREQLIRRAFQCRHIDDSLRARLRVEITRLRGELRKLAGINATKNGFVLVPRHARQVVVLTHPVEEKHAAVLAHLADGEAWSSSALALALRTSQRTILRELNCLLSEGKVQALGHGRSRRWAILPVPGFATTLLLPMTFLND